MRALAFGMALLATGCATSAAPVAVPSPVPVATNSGYRVELKTGQLHETYNPNEDKESKLLVTRNGVTKTYEFMMGCKMAYDRSEIGVVVLDCPKEFSGVFIANELLKVDLATGKRETLLDQIVWNFKSEPMPPSNFWIGVRNTKRLRDANARDRELFVLWVDPDTLGKSSVDRLAKGSWLPSDNDLEFAGGPEGWKRLEAKWAKLFRFEARSGELAFLYRSGPKKAFKRYEF